jgi:hypothetical protein
MVAVTHSRLRSDFEAMGEPKGETHGDAILFAI